MTRSDQDAFAASMGRVQACYNAQRQAKALEELLNERSYRGPVALIGPSVRDEALARDPGVPYIVVDLQHLSQVAMEKIVRLPIDLHAIPRQHLVKYGYDPQLTNDRYNQETFLKAVIAITPLRINAIGATPHGILADAQWDYDAYYNRMVLRYGMADEAARPEELLENLVQTKYRDWTIHHELADGELEIGLPSHSVLGHGD